MKASMVGLRFKGRYVYNLFGRCAQTERKNRAADYPLALAQLDLGEIEDYSGSSGYHPDGEVDYALVWLKISGWADFKTSIRMKINTICLSMFGRFFISTSTSEFQVSAIRKHLKFVEKLEGKNAFGHRA